MIIDKEMLRRAVIFVNNKMIQEQRKKGYFIEAAKKIIKKEGVETLTVKKIADLAGFAPGTLYNYFRDLDDLFSYCVVDFWDECKEYVFNNMNKDSDIKKKIISSARAYCEFFLNNPHVFQVIFLEDLEEVPREIPEVVLFLTEQLEKGAKKGLISPDKLSIVKNLISNSIHGLLLFYMKKRTKADKDEILIMVEKEIDYLVKDY
jgi:AcrR family transcriptional regulator